MSKEISTHNQKGYCGEPKIPQYGEITHGSLYIYPHTVEFGCDEGYFLKGQKVIRCQIDGIWSASSPKCVSADGPFPWWAFVVIVVIALPLVSYTIVKCYSRLTMIEENENGDQAYESIPVMSMAFDDKAITNHKDTTTAHLSKCTENKAVAAGPLTETLHNNQSSACS